MILYAFALFFSTRGKNIRGASFANCAPTGPHNQPWVVFVGGMRRQKWRVKAVSCSRASSEIVPAFLWDHPQKPLAQAAPEGERWGEIG